MEQKIPGTEIKLSEPIVEYYVFVRETPTSPWLQSSSWATVEDACEAADKLLASIDDLEAMGEDTQEDQEGDQQVAIFICKSENGAFPVPFFNWCEQE